MNSNLISVGQLLEKGFLVTTMDNLLKLYDHNKKLIMQSKHGRNRTFKVNVATPNTLCLSATSVEGESELWPKRLGHMNFISLGHMSSKYLVHGIPKIMEPEKSYDLCMRDKKPRLPFSFEIPPRATHVLGVVHFDVCSVFEVPSLGGNKYFV